MLGSKWLGFIKLGAILAVIGYGLFVLNTFRAEKAALAAQVLQEAIEKVSAQAHAQELRNANILLGDALSVQEASLYRLEAQLTELNGEFGELRRTRDAERAVFDEHDFAMLTGARPGLIERLANRATAERFERFEQVLNGG